MTIEQFINTLRTMINDLDTPYKYTDERLTSVILIAARQVNTELGFNYTISNTSITPEADDIFFNLVSLKSACMIDFNEARAAGGITKLKQGNNEIQTDKSSAVKIWQNGWCDAYETAKMEYKAGGIDTPGAILIGPTRYYGSPRGYR